eukprot:gnl/TRDRNA2_/TRDRNA2_160543_c0_seq1.p1 gnl/TRDRNA2_/TRDRNA2_160543_c0~~gnl/TRDRNA2_/TRDRNA2_160543_c0_seq1.p1  ORF type:complete len:182 (+),score=52.94 gnl/TRDRNA2_/TRDRNA2_160543_c0_seq1:32-547(+)
MVGWMSQGKRKFESLEPIMRRLIPQLHTSMMDSIPNIDADTNAFNAYFAAMKMPKGDGEDSPQGRVRQAAMQEGLKLAIEAPLTTMRQGDKAWDAMVEMAKHGNIDSKSDLQVGARLLEVGIWGAHQNVLINIKDIKDEEYKARILKESEETVERAAKKMKETLAELDARG